MLDLRNDMPMTLSAVALRLGISARTVRKWANKGRAGRTLDVVRIGHRTVRTTWSAVDDFLSNDPAGSVGQHSAAARQALEQLEKRHGIKIDQRNPANDCQSGSEVSALR